MQIEKKISDLQEDIRYYAKIIEKINYDNIIDDRTSIYQSDWYSDLKQYFNDEKLIKELLNHSIVLYTSPHFNFYELYKVKKTNNIVEFLESYLNALKQWAKQEVESLIDFYEFDRENNKEIVYKIMQQIGERTEYKKLKEYYENPLDTCSWVEEIKETWEIKIDDKKWTVEVKKTIGGYIDQINELEFFKEPED